MRRSLFLWVAACLALGARPLLAHHSFAAEFDDKQPLKITGTIKKVEWTNPHIWYYVEVKNPDGTTTMWALSGGAPGQLMRRGIRKEALVLGAVVMRPASIDTIVATNLHADILSDLAAALAGSLGIAPTGNINPERTFPSMFEPIHGSAFDIMGKGIANPIGTFWSAVMMLEHLGQKPAADRLMAAIERVTADPRFHTPTPGEIEAATPEGFRKVWEPWELKRLADGIGFTLPQGERWVEKGLVDGDNSGSASLDWAAKPGASVEEIMAGVSMPLGEIFSTYRDQNQHFLFSILARVATDLFGDGAWREEKPRREQPTTHLTERTPRRQRK